ncbi:MAG: pentapeptide repeat-containing protein, partial [Opitutaceae bacterium]
VLPMDLTQLSGKFSLTESDIPGSIFKNVNLAKTEFTDINLADSRFDDINFTGTRITNVNLTNVDIRDCNIDGLRIDGHLVSDLLKSRS